MSQKRPFYDISIPIFSHKNHLFFSNGKKYVVNSLFVLQIRASGDKNTYFVVENPLFKAIFGQNSTFENAVTSNKTGQ